MAEPRERGDGGLACFRSLFEEAETALALIGSGQRYIILNPAYARLMGYGSEDLVGQPVSLTAHREDAARTATLHRRLLSGEIDHVTLRGRCVRQDGAVFPARFKMWPVRDANLRTLAVLSLAEEITEPWRQGADLPGAAMGYALASETPLLSQVSHELRTPLNAIMGFADIMRSELVGPLGNTRYRQYAEDIHSSGSHLLELIDGMLHARK